MINAITGAPVAESSAQSIADASAGDTDMFLQLLVAQVRYQDPLEPMNNNEAMAQTAQFTMVEQMTKVAEQQQELLAFQQATLAAGMIGRSATGVDEVDGSIVSGVVSSVEFNQGDPQLIIDGQRVAVDSIVSTSDPDTVSERQVRDDTESKDATSE